MTPATIDRASRAALAALAVALAVLAASRAALGADPPVSTDTPVATVASLHRGLVALARDRPAADLAERYRALAPLVAETHDLPYIAELALRRQWPMLSEPERTRFVAAFEKLSVTTYASRFKNVKPETFKEPSSVATGTEGAGGASGAARAQVAAAIARPGEPDVSLEYTLQQKDGAWRIVNIVADGVSDLALKRAEYQRVLASGTIDDLIRLVEDQTARLAQN
jgi:phospholipid transport system substrate-binding protein